MPTLWTALVQRTLRGRLATLIRHGVASGLSGPSGKSLLTLGPHIRRAEVPIGATSPTYDDGGS